MSLLLSAYDSFNYFCFVLYFDARTNNSIFRNTRVPKQIVFQKKIHKNLANVPGEGAGGAQHNQPSGKYSFKPQGDGITSIRMPSPPELKNNRAFRKWKPCWVRI